MYLIEYKYYFVQSHDLWDMKRHAFSGSIVLRE